MARVNKKKNTPNSQTRPQGQQQGNAQREQPKKDSSSKRVNLDNERGSKFEKEFQEERHSRKGYDKPMKASKEVKSGASNDVTWYAHTPELLRAAASIPFTDAVGDRINPNADFAFPGVFAVSWVPGIDGDAVNQSANSHYSFTVHANSRDYRYDAPDQMMMILAGAQLFTAIAMGIRAYGVMRRFDQLDRYTPAALVTAMGFDYDDLKKHLSNMWFDLNEIISRSAQIWIPKDMPVIDRWFWMSSHIYKDANSSKAQYYMYVPAQLLMLSETGSAKGTSLKPTNWTNQQPSTWEEYVSLINTMFSALLQSQDRGIIFGDLLAAYGAERIFALSGIDSSYMVEPVHDPEVLTQFENCVVGRTLVNAVTQDENGIISSSYDITTTTDLPYRRGLQAAVLNFHQLEAPTPEQIMVATRMMCLGKQVVIAQTTEGVVLKPETFGTEIPFDYTIYTNQFDKGSYIPVLGKYRYSNFINYGKDYPTAATPRYLQMWEAFDWCPIRYHFDDDAEAYEEIDYTVVGSRGSWFASHEIGDVDMFTHINVETLRKMHTTAVYSEFGVPTLL